METLQCSRCGGTRYDTNHRCEKGYGVMKAKDEVESLRARLEQVESERDELSRDWDSEHYHRLAVERDRDAPAEYLAEARGFLVGHVQILLDIANTMPVTSVAEDKLRRRYKEEASRAEALYANFPMHIRERRDAGVKSEALEHALSEMMLEVLPGESVVGLVEDLRDKYRQQAEGGGE